MTDIESRNMLLNKKVKQSHYRLGQALSVQPYAQAAFTPRKYTLVLISVRG